MHNRKCMIIVVLTDEQIEALKNGEKIRTSLNGETFEIASQKWVDDMHRKQFEIDPGWASPLSPPLGFRE